VVILGRNSIIQSEYKNGLQYDTQYITWKQRLAMNPERSWKPIIYYGHIYMDQKQISGIFALIHWKKSTQCCRWAAWLKIWTGVLAKAEKWLCAGRCYLWLSVSGAFPLFAKSTMPCGWLIRFLRMLPLSPANIIPVTSFNIMLTPANRVQPCVLLLQGRMTTDRLKGKCSDIRIR